MRDDFQIVAPSLVNKRGTHLFAVTTAGAKCGPLLGNYLGVVRFAAELANWTFSPLSGYLGS